MILLFRCYHSNPLKMYTLMINQNDQVSSAEQPGEHAMIKVDLMSDFLFMDNCNTMLDDTNLIVISELG